MGIQNDWPWLITVVLGWGADYKNRAIKAIKWAESSGISGQKMGQK